jgi:hypothetical protein
MVPTIICCEGWRKRLEQKPADLQAFPPMEPTGIEPVTSCSQNDTLDSLYGVSVQLVGDITVLRRILWRGAC